MSGFIAQTKFHRPRLQSNFVPRARLSGLLENQPGQVFTLVSAPAGYGKSSLVSGWLDDDELNSAWLSLDDGDKGLPDFLSYFVAAERTHAPDSCLRIDELLEAAELPPIQVLGDCLANDLDAFEKRFILVLDDYHCVDSVEINALLDHLLRPRLQPNRATLAAPERTLPRWILHQAKPRPQRPAR